MEPGIIAYCLQTDVQIACLTLEHVKAVTLLEPRGSTDAHEMFEAEPLYLVSPNMEERSFTAATALVNWGPNQGPQMIDSVSLFHRIINLLFCSSSKQGYWHCIQRHNVEWREGCSGFESHETSLQLPAWQSMAYQEGRKLWDQVWRPDS